MLVLADGDYNFANMVVKVTDNTIQQPNNANITPPTPDLNVLIPTVQAVGSTNTMELYYPESTEITRYVKAHGMPDPTKFGFGPDFIHGILSRWQSGVGVYTVNLRGPSATIANLMVVLKYKVEADVPYTDEDGNPYYVDANGQVTTIPTGGTPIVRDVLHTKYVLANIEDCKKWTDLHKAMNGITSEVEDDEGYKTLPLFGVMYRGASAFGNNVFFNMTPKRAEYDGNVYYALTIFDGQNTTTTDYNYSLYNRAGEKYNTSYFIEDMFNNAFPTMRMLTAENIQDVYDLYNKYLYTLDDVIAGKADKPSKSFGEVDVFAAAEFGVVVDEGSLVSTIANCFMLVGGDDGSETRDELFKMFFEGKIIGDIANPLRYRIVYVPDIGYNVETKYAIRDYITRMNRMCSSTIMLGSDDTFSSALLDHQANWYETMPNIRQLAKCQSPMMYNKFIRRTVTYPGTYYDTMALMDHFIKWGNFFQPFAGADARWMGFIDDTMMYPDDETTYLNSLYNSRINVCMKDSEEGAYLSDQQMNTVLTSDQTEFNNGLMISCMLYDLLQLVHKNHFKFNEPEDVRIFGNAVNDTINSKYEQYSASLSCEVFRLGTIGREKSANKIVVTVNMRDINKYATVDIVLTDE